MAGMKELAKAAGFQRASVVEDVFEVIMKMVERGEPVTIRGFGTFRRQIHRGRTQITPLVEGGKVTYKDRWVLKFKPSDAAKDRINRSKPKPKGKKRKKKGKKKVRR